MDTRRDFLRTVGAAAVAAGLGTRLEAQEEARLTFGALEPLVALMQETPIGRFQELVVRKAREGTSLKDLTAAAALANARTFGGDDYIGFHAMFALRPAYDMARDLPEERRLLPVLKALYRNTDRIQAFGGRAKEVLKPVAPREGSLREAVRALDVGRAEAALAASCATSPAAGFNALQASLHDSTEVHRVNLVYRAWGLLDLVGLEHAHTMLRQSLHYFAAQEGGKMRDRFSGARDLLPKLVDQHKLADKPLGTRRPDDAWVERMSLELFPAPPERAAEMAAAALAEGMSPDGLHEAIAIAANQMVLRDENKVAHGNTNGVHCADAVNAWKHIGRASGPSNAAAAAILSAYHFAFDRENPKRNKFVEWEPYPRPDAIGRVASKDPDALLRELDGAIRSRDQAQASAVVHRYGSLGAPAAPVFALFRGYVISQHGSLHGEKYFGTVSEEFAAARAPFKWRQLVAMARYAASMYGEPSPGYEEAVKLLGVPG